MWETGQMGNMKGRGQSVEDRQGERQTGRETDSGRKGGEKAKIKEEKKGR